MTYGIIYTVIEDKRAGPNSDLLTKAGTRCYVEYDATDHWYEASRLDSGMPVRFAAFKRRDEAHAFMGQWKGHPWYYGRKVEDPYEVIELEPRMVQSGWVIKQAGERVSPEAPVAKLQIGVEAYKAKNAQNNWTGRGYGLEPFFMNLNHEGGASVGFAEKDANYEQDDETGRAYVYCNSPVSEVLALRDFLNEAFPVRPAEVGADHFLTAFVSKDGKVTGIDHETSADWKDVFTAHIALRDWLNERIEKQSLCPFSPDPAGETSK
jgi:hypothetical protein